MITIDGSFGEGGGQMIRTSLSLAAITGTPFEISPIRPNRDKPGLRPQHLHACLAVQQICPGELQGAESQSTRLYYQPGAIQGGAYVVNVGTAGAIVLIAQTLIPICLFASRKTTLHLIGGTHVRKSPSFDYFEKVFLKALQRFNVFVDSTLLKPGYYPKGGGEIIIEIQPQKMNGCMNWKTTSEMSAIIRLSRIPISVAERESKALRENDVAEVTIQEDFAYSPGNAITLYQGFKGTSVLGERGVMAETVALKAIAALNQEKDGQVDQYLADQLLLYAALANGKTCFTTSSITPHLLTNKTIIEKFINRNICINDQTISVQ